MTRFSSLDAFSPGFYIAADGRSLMFQGAITTDPVFVQYLDQETLSPDVIARVLNEHITAVFDLVETGVAQ